MSWGLIAREAHPYVALKLISLRPDFPLLVVIITTPLAPRASYKAPEEASFNTVIDSISDGLIELSDPSKKTPSTTYICIIHTFYQ